MKTKANSYGEIHYKEIGEQIRRRRKGRGLTKKALAERADLTEQHISHIERGTTKLSLPALLGISKALEIDINNLLGRNSFQAEDVLLGEMAKLLKGADPDGVALCLRICRAVLEQPGEAGER